MKALEKALKVMFIDHQAEKIEIFWKEVKKDFDETFGHDFEKYFQIVKFSKFLSQEETIQSIEINRPNIIFLGIGLGVLIPTGITLARELANLQKWRDELSYYVYANTDGDPSDFAKEGTVSVCGSCSWNSSRCLNLLLKTHSDVLSYGLGKELKYVINLAQLKFSDNFFRESSSSMYKFEEKILSHLNVGIISDELPKLIDCFIKSRVNVRSQHGYWVHGLSHFDSKLWEFGQLNSIKKLYTEAVKGAIETEDLNCLGRILRVFVEKYSKEKGNKEDYGLGFDNLEKLKPINEFYISKVPSLMGCYFRPEIIEQINSL